MPVDEVIGPGQTWLVKPEIGSYLTVLAEIGPGLLQGRDRHRRGPRDGQRREGGPAMTLTPEQEARLHEAADPDIAAALAEIERLHRPLEILAGFDASLPKRRIDAVQEAFGWCAADMARWILDRCAEARAVLAAPVDQGAKEGE